MSEQGRAGVHKIQTVLKKNSDFDWIPRAKVTIKDFQKTEISEHRSL